MSDCTDNLKRLRALGNRGGVADQMELRLRHEMLTAIESYDRGRVPSVTVAVATCSRKPFGWKCVRRVE